LLSTKNVTLSLDESTLEAGRDHAKRQDMSLNAPIRQLLSQHAVRSSSANSNAKRSFAAGRSRILSMPLDELPTADA